MAMLGMDIEQVDAFAALLNQKANTDIEGIIGQIQGAWSQVNTPSVWAGADATNFDQVWQDCRTNLGFVKQALLDAEQAARRQIEEQQAASS